VWGTSSGLNTDQSLKSQFELFTANASVLKMSVTARTIARSPRTWHNHVIVVSRAYLRAMETTGMQIYHGSMQVIGHGRNHMSSARFWKLCAETRRASKVCAAFVGVMRLFHWTPELPASTCSHQRSCTEQCRTNRCGLHCTRVCMVSEQWI